MDALRKATINYLIRTQEVKNWDWNNEANTAGQVLGACTVESLEGAMLTLKDKNGKLHTSREEQFTMR